MRENVFAHTALGGSFPEYISVNRDGDKIEVTVRGPAKPATAERPYLDAGDVAAISLTHEQVAKLAEALFMV